MFASGGTPEELEMVFQQSAAALEQLQSIHEALKRRAPRSLLEDPCWIFICVVDHPLTDLQLHQLAVLRLAGHPLAVRTAVIYANFACQPVQQGWFLQRRFAALDKYLSNQGLEGRKEGRKNYSSLAASKADRME